ncbi:MAG: hypothetical protein R3B13_18695 [Polyangiaceae bacterium]
MRWVSSDGEFAFFAYGAVANGVIAVGGVAHGVIALGGIASLGVVSIGMNAAGTFIAVGLNAVAPICYSMINGLGVYTVAGVNGWGAWAKAGTNATGALSAEGFINSNISWVPAIVVLALLVGFSSAMRGRRQSRSGSAPHSLRQFLRSPQMNEARVAARLTGVTANAIELQQGWSSATFSSSESVVQAARAIASAASKRTPHVVAEVHRAQERVFESPDPELSYRKGPREAQRIALRCHAIKAPDAKPWLPVDAEEVKWVIAWSARLAVVVVAVLLYVAAR